MVATVQDLMHVVRANPYIDGIGYFVEVTTTKPVPEEGADRLTQRMHADFCQHAQVTLEGDNVLGFDFHEHILTQGEDSRHFLAALQEILEAVERRWGIDHLCVEFQFDFHRARVAQLEVDELLKP